MRAGTETEPHTARGLLSARGPWTDTSPVSTPWGPHGVPNPLDISPASLVPEASIRKMGRKDSVPESSCGEESGSKDI
jgi:hypothetical protein